MKSVQEIIKEKPYMAWVFFIITVVVVFFIGLFASEIVERRWESAMLQVVKPIAGWEPRNAVWGENYPREYESYVSTTDTSFHSKYGGSAKIDYLKDDPNLVILWAGYAFSKEYNQGRGHYHAIEDIRNILRTVQPQPATCWTCKSTDVPRVMNQMGAGKFYHETWMNMGPQIHNPIGCQDCHDPATMNLRITRPALTEALARQGRDITKATRQEMRSYVCAQCHVEYYFKGQEKYLTFPWDKGFSADSMEAYYDKAGFSDWVHQLSRAPMLKAQHPDFELFRTGVHADRGVACADCHMPYKSEGGIKYTNHKIQSPLNDISNSCQVCHRESEEKLRNNVYERQDKILQSKLLAEGELVKAHIEAKSAWDKGANEEEMKPVLTLIRHAQWRWDWVAAANALSFHSPIEAQRVLATSIQKASEARILLAGILFRHGLAIQINFPDISSQAKAQSYIGLDMDKLRKDKAEFIKNIVPLWEHESEIREGVKKY